MDTRATLFHPQLSYARGDYSYSFDPHESQSLLKIELPAFLLKSGENRITISCFTDPPTDPSAQRAAISYDALSLDQNATETFDASATSAQVVPTIFYRQGPTGLTEIVDVFLRSNGPHPAGSMQLALGDRKFTQPLPTQQGIGEQRVSFAVPEFDGPVNGDLTISAGSERTLPVRIVPERKWTVYVVPHTHLDLGFTDYQGKVAEIQARILGQAADLIHAHPDFRFSMDGSWNLQQLLETRSKKKQDEVLGLIGAGKMAVPAQYCNLLTGYASLETLYRSLYESRKLSRKYGFPFEYANITDVPTYSGAYPSILASSGIKYWVAGANNDDAPIFYYDHWNEHSPFWWEGPDGQKVLFWYSRHYMQVQVLFGIPPSQIAIRDSLPIYLQAYSKPAYKPDVALIFGTQAENTDLSPQTATFVNAWDKEYAFPKLEYATFSDFFHYVDEHYGKDLATFKGEGSGYWELGVASDAYFTAEDRRNQNRALSAEVLSTVTQSVNPTLHAPAGVMDDIWSNIVLYAEHTWTSYNSVTQPDHQQSVKQLRVKDDRADRANLEIEDVVNRSLSQLADQIHAPSKTLVVFNSLSWRRDAVVETDLNENPKLTDLSTQQDVPLQILSNREGFVHVRFLARDLPAVGYKCFRLSYATSNKVTEQPEFADTIENKFYRIRVDVSTGAIASIYDKQLQREIVDKKDAYKFGEYLYVTGGDGQTSLNNSFPSLPSPQLVVHGSAGGKILSVQHMDWGESIRMLGSAMNTPEIETEVLLLNDQKRIEIRYRVQKDYTNNKEGVYFAFPVAVPTPSFAYANQMGWVDPAHDIMKGGSLEVFSVQRWMAVHDSNLAVGIVPLDSPLATFGDIYRGTWPGEFHPVSGSLFSFAMNNYYYTNYRGGQKGPFEFRFAITSSKNLDGGALSRFGLEEMRAPELDEVTSQDKVINPERPLPGSQAGFLDISNPNVALITWKQAEDGRGMILRLAELAGKAATTTLQFLA